MTRNRGPNSRIESRVVGAETARLPDLVRRAPAPLPDATHETIDEAVRALSLASRPVILAGRVGRDQDHWRRRVELAERLGARVVTDLKTGAAFPTDHPLHVPGPGFFLSDDAKRLLAEADCLLSLDWIDLAGTLGQFSSQDASATIILASVDHVVHRGWTMDHFGLPPVDVHLVTGPDRAVARLLDRLPGKAPAPLPIAHPPARSSDPSDGSLTLNDLSRALRAATEGEEVCLIRLPMGWSGDAWVFRHPLDYLGYDGGAGVGSGPGMAVGAALALRGRDRLPIAVLGDGDFLMGVQALWTAARHRIPLLVVVANNRSYFNDELHQERVAVSRGRDPRNRWVGQRIADPAPDLAALARAQGLRAWGPVTAPADLDRTLRSAVQTVRSGGSTVVDVVVGAGYDPTTAARVAG